VEGGRPRRVRSTYDTRLLHGGELGFGGSQLLWIQSTGSCKNWRTWLREEMMLDSMTRFRGCKTVGRGYVWKFGE